METLRKAINKAIKNNITFYAYRLPDDRLYHFSAPITSQTYESEGFKVSPFDDFRLPSVFIHKGLNAYDFCNCGLAKDSVVLLEQVRTIDKRRLKEKMGSLDNTDMGKVDHALTVSFGL